MKLKNKGDYSLHSQGTPYKKIKKTQKGIQSVNSTKNYSKICVL